MMMTSSAGPLMMMSSSAGLDACWLEGSTLLEVVVGVAVEERASASTKAESNSNMERSFVKMSYQLLTAFEL